MYSHTMQVTASHTGTDGLQTPVSVITMMQDCSQLGVDTEQGMQEFLRDNDIAMMIAARQVDFASMAPYKTVLFAKTGVYDGNGYMGYRNTALYGEDGTQYACSWSIGIFVSLKTGKVVRLPKDVFDSVTYDEKLPMQYLGKRIDIPDCTPKVLPSLRAQRSDIDINKHVNNVQYLRMAYEYVPEDTQYGRLRVEYKQAAKLGDVLVPHLYDGGSDAVCVALLDGQEKPYVTVEFSQPRPRKTNYEVAL